ncbi:MAG: MtrB/PioB family decaheme-associated outer membrane protein [Steroidobacteraceae bacterium]|jgi:MtrB/PioB family decaheme-associated outer membrane protein
MKARDRQFSRKLMSLAVPCALAAAIAAPPNTLAQDADTDDIKALTLPTNFLQAGGNYNSNASDKFGEYNGLNKQGTTFVGDLSLAGGDAYGPGTGTMRYGLSGTDLGTTAASLNASASNQGRWNLGLGYDELRHELTDSYQTPFQGAVGGNNFTLPSDFGVINTGYKPPGFKTAPGTNNLTAQQLSDFHSEDIHTDRKNSSLTAGYRFDANWDVKVDFNHLTQDGAKLFGVGGDQVNSPAGSTYTWAGQTPLVLANPIEYGTDTIKLAANWVGTKSNATLGYYGSIFHDNYNSVSWNNPFIKAPATVATGTLSAFPTDSISTFPSNLFNQLNLTGGYEFSSSTKLTGGLSYGRSQQNVLYAGSGNIGLNPLGVPVDSLQGLVDIEHVDLKLTNQSWRPLVLSAGLKFNERDNKTPSNAYTFNTINESAAQTETSINAPMSNKKTQADVSADYRISSQQHLSVSYEFDDTKRWCNNAAANYAQGSLDAAATGSWAAYTAATCAEVPDTKEDKMTVAYRLRASDSLNFNASYLYSWRKANASSTFYNPMQAVDNPAGSGAGAEGYEVLGFMSFFEASRHEQVVKAGANWQPGDKLSLGLNGRYTEDQYTDLTYGVQDSHSASANFDSTYIFNERRSVSLYVTYQDSSRNLTNLYKVTNSAATATGLSGVAGETWTNNLKESDTTIGAGARQDGLFASRLNLAVDLSYSLGNTTYNTSPFAGSDLEGNTCNSIYYETCGSPPTIKNSTLRLRVNGSYDLGKSGTGGKILMGYTFERLASDDFLYNAYQYGYTPATLLPTNQQSPSYQMSAIFVAYRYSYR